MSTSFNLITSSWIPVIPIGSSHPILVGIHEAIAEASRFQSVSAPTPLETAAVYRLLLAVTHAAIDVDDSTWKSIWKDGSLGNNYLEGYLDQWAHRFELFDNDHPFYQDRNLQSKPESVSSLRGHLASGADSTLFSHNTQQHRLVFSASEAALALLSIQNFGLGGTKGAGKSFYDAPCARGVVIVVEGRSLFETLMLNLVDRDMSSMTFYRLRKNISDRPSWEMENPFIDDPRRPYGLLDHLTWHNRRVRLLVDDYVSSEPVVSQMMYDIGLRTSDAEKKSVRDTFNPMHYWRVNTRKAKGSNARSHSPLYLIQEKAIWRDSNVLFQVGKSKDDNADKPPAALEQIRTLIDEKFLDKGRTYRLVGFGACTEPGQDKTYFYRSESLPLPSKLLIDSDLVSHLSSALQSAEGTARALRRSVFLLALLVLYPRTTDNTIDSQDKVDDRIGKGKNTKSKDRDAQQAYKLSESWGIETCFWSEMEPHFHRFMEDLPGQSDDAVQAWRKSARRAAQSAFNQAASYAGDDLRAQRAAAVARQQFDKGLTAALGKANPADNKEGDMPE